MAEVSPLRRRMSGPLLTGALRYSEERRSRLEQPIQARFED
jgi:hypothetical protein